MTQLNTQTDENIVAQVVSGNIDAYETLMSRYEQKLLRYVIYLIHDDSLATDIVQETFIKTYQNLNRFNSKFKFSSWIYRIAHNQTMNFVKHNKHYTTSDIDSLPDLSYESNLANKIDQAFLKKDVQNCLKELEPKYREIIQLVYYENMKYAEISDILQIPTSTVGVWLSRAKTKLKHICEKKGTHRG